MDYRLNYVIPVNRPYAELQASAIRTEALRHVAQSLRDNLLRVDRLAIAALCEELGKHGGVAQSFGGDRNDGTDALNEWSFGTDSPGEDAFVHRLLHGLASIQGMHHSLHHGLQAWLASLLTGTWTAFETFACDLWVATLNAHPRSLARLNGKPNNRISDKAGAKTEKNEGTRDDKGDRGKSLSLNWIHDASHGDYDLSSHMGDILKVRYNFTILASIREAYSNAFDPEDLDGKFVDEIDDTLAKNSSLDALCEVRNLIVHRGGIADDKYVSKTKGIDHAPKLKENDKLHLDGEIVKVLVDPVAECCSKLLVTIDKWLDAEKGP
jgi:hypothetical protein